VLQHAGTLLHQHLGNPGAAFSKVPRKILGKLLTLGATDTQVATSSRGYSTTVEHCTNIPINSIQRTNGKLCSSSSSNSSSNIRSFPNIFLGTFENVALVQDMFFLPRNLGMIDLILRNPRQPGIN